MADWEVPEGLGVGGRGLWDSITGDHDLDVFQMVQLTEACRAKGRLDKLDEQLRGDADTWMRLEHSSLTQDYELKVDKAAQLANATADHMKKLLNALRLPDETANQPSRSLLGNISGGLDCESPRQGPWS